MTAAQMPIVSSLSRQMETEEDEIQLFQGITKTPTTLIDHMSSAGKVTGKTAAEESKLQYAMLTPEQEHQTKTVSDSPTVNADLAKEVEEIKKEHLIQTL